jgi:hypothetical protein
MAVILRFKLGSGEESRDLSRMLAQVYVLPKSEFFPKVTLCANAPCAHNFGQFLKFLLKGASFPRSGDEIGAPRHQSRRCMVDQA